MVNTSKLSFKFDGLYFDTLVDGLEDFYKIVKLSFQA